MIIEKYLKTFLLLILTVLIMFVGIVSATQHDMDVSVDDANTGTTVRDGFNDAIQALASTSSGATPPSTTYAHQLWADTTNDLLKIRNAANNAWITIGTLDESGNTFESSTIEPMKTVSSYPYTITTADSTLLFTGTGTVNFPQQSAVSSAVIKETFLLINTGAGITTLAPFAGDSLPDTTLLPGDGILYIGSGGTTWIEQKGYILDEDDMSSNSDTRAATQQSIKAYIDTSVPAGSITAYAGETAPTYWLECDGDTGLSTVVNPEYLDLFAVIGTIYGGTGTTDFDLPDLRGQFIRGYDHGAGTDPDAAGRTDRGDGTGGDNVGSKQADAFESHVHPSVVSNAGLTAVGANGFLVTSGDTSPTGGNETRPTNVYMMYIIKY